jgi:SAM-dependent methyltransferase
VRELGFRRFVSPVIDVDRLAAAPQGYRRFLADFRRYRQMTPDGEVSLAEAYPQLHDRVPRSPFDAHYFHQDVWAARRVAELRPDRHVDVGSRVDYVGFLTSITAVTFVDIRPLEVNIEGLTSIAGSVLDMPFDDRSLPSLSCLHVAEHIGLGRYGDPLDPQGTRRAAAELQRVLAPGGQLLFSVPVGRPRTCFNAHRIHAPEDVLAMFPELELVEFAGVDDAGVFRRHRQLGELSGERYACGLFHLVRRDDQPVAGR